MASAEPHGRRGRSGAANTRSRVAPARVEAFLRFAQRLYAPTAARIDSIHLSMTFAGDGVQTPNNDLLNFRQIGNVVLTVSKALPDDDPEQRQHSLTRIFGLDRALGLPASLDRQPAFKWIPAHADPDDGRLIPQSLPWYAARRLSLSACGPQDGHLGSVTFT